MKRWLAILLLSMLPACSMLEAWKGQLDYNHKTGQLEGDLKGASPGGQYNENTGLNLTSGDNTVPALLVAGVLGMGVIFAYPIQRTLRLRKEEKYREWLKTQKNGEDT